MVVASAIVSGISFFLPFDTVKEYTWETIIRHEMDYMFVTFKGFLFGSGVFGGVLFLFNLLIHAFCSKRNWIIYKSLVLLSNIGILYLFLYWLVTNYDMNEGFRQFVFPVYTLSMVVFGLLFLKKRN
jgi:hypothetical protein